MGMAISYLNKMTKRFVEDKKLSKNFSIHNSIIPSVDFETGLKKTHTISNMEIFVEKKIIGTEYLNFMDFDSNTQDDLTISIKAKPRKTLSVKNVLNVFRKISSEDEMVKRVRIRGRDANKMGVLLDSMNGKKVDEITVDLKENGVVDSYSFFSKVEELLGVCE